MEFVAAMFPSPASCQLVIEYRQEKRRIGDEDIAATKPTALDFRLSGLAAGGFPSARTRPLSAVRKYIQQEELEGRLSEAPRYYKRRTRRWGHRRYRKR
jgi:hypothetical protein